MNGSGMDPLGFDQTIPRLQSALEGDYSLPEE